MIIPNRVIFVSDAVLEKSFVQTPAHATAQLF